MTRRTQADRSAATRAALIAAGRRLFAEHGFAGVGTEAIVAEAEVSRGALYHHFADKKQLFIAVMDAVETDVTDRLAEAALSSGSTDFEALMMGALHAWLDACEAPEVHRIVLMDGPSVLGWAQWRELIQPYAMSLVEGLLIQGIDEGSVAPLPTRPLAHVLVSIADEAAMYVVSAQDKESARRDMVQVMERLLSALPTS